MGVTNKTYDLLISSILCITLICLLLLPRSDFARVPKTIICCLAIIVFSVLISGKSTANDSIRDCQRAKLLHIILLSTVCLGLIICSAVSISYASGKADRFFLMHPSYFNVIKWAEVLLAITQAGILFISAHSTKVDVSYLTSFAHSIGAFACQIQCLSALTGISNEWSGRITAELIYTPLALYIAIGGVGTGISILFIVKRGKIK